MTVYTEKARRHIAAVHKNYLEDNILPWSATEPRHILLLEALFRFEPIKAAGTFIPKSIHQGRNIIFLLPS